LSRQTKSTDSDAPGDLAGYELILAVCGGIAAYKLCQVTSTLVQRGCGVTVGMTTAATRFVGPTTFQSLTGRQVFTTLWDAQDYYDPQHLKLSSRADLLLVAPATANILGKAACGIADELVSTMIMAAGCPVVFAPAMNQRMWCNPVVERNILTLTDLGYSFIEPTSGWLACGEVGPGRLAEVDTIIAFVADRLKAAVPKSAG